MVAFTDDLLKSALEGDQQSVEIVSSATSRQFVCRSVASSSPSTFHAFRGAPEALDSPPDAINRGRPADSLRRRLTVSPLKHLTLPTTLPLYISHTYVCINKTIIIKDT